jgi:predicted PhzF superfamily epimerase YddE/YHI9
LEAHSTPRDLLLLVAGEAQVQALRPQIPALAALHWHGVIVTAKGESADFVSRFFAPNMGVAEDPVTGSSHCTLAPFWAERLGKQTLTARQLSARGGTLSCKHNGARVSIAGHASLYLEGTLHVE